MRRFLQAAFVVVALISSGVRAPAADDAQSLLDKNKAFAGWAFGDPSMNGLRLTGQIGKMQVIDLRRGAIWKRSFTDRAKLKILRSTKSYGLNGETNASIARADTIKVGGNILHNVIIGVGSNAHGRWEDFDGLFGFDLLAGAIVDIDMSKQQMTIFGPSKYSVNATGPALPLDLRRGWATVPVTLDGRVKAHLSFDTGDPMSVFVTDKLYGGPRGVQIRFVGFSSMGGSGGDSHNYAHCGRMESMEIGTIRYGDVPVCFGASKVLFGNDGGIIGLDFIKHFDLTFDYPDGLLYLTKI